MRLFLSQNCIYQSKLRLSKKGTHKSSLIVILKLTAANYIIDLPEVCTVINSLSHIIRLADIFCILQAWQEQKVTQKWCKSAQNQETKWESPPVLDELWFALDEDITFKMFTGWTLILAHSLKLQVTSGFSMLQVIIRVWPGPTQYVGTGDSLCSLHLKIFQKEKLCCYP